MPCISPYTVRHPDGLIDRVRCGRCRYCRIRRKMAWVGRLRLELADAGVGRFITLTYQEDPGILEVKDLQDFLKRYRYYYGRFRYFAVGEYGEKSGRGHWHLIVFGHSPVTIGHWKQNKAWSHGFSYDGTVGVESIGYVAGYVLKPAPSPDRNPLTRRSLKPGIGFRRIAAMASAVAPRGIEAWPSEFRVGGRRYPLCDGGLRLFMREYLNAGGCPPEIHSPELRDKIARLELADWGTRIQEKRAAKVYHFRDKGADRYGTQSVTKQKI